MSAPERVRRQFDTAWALLAHHLDGLTTEECLWRPADIGPHVRQDAEGLWRADWPDQEGYELGPPSIAWTGWHLGFWWSTALDRNFGEGTLAREEIAWPGDAEGVRTWLEGLRDLWLETLARLGDEVLETAPSSWPAEGRPLIDMFLWANLELTKNAAEIGYARFLFARRGDAVIVR